MKQALKHIRPTIKTVCLCLCGLMLFTNTVNGFHVQNTNNPKQQIEIVLLGTGTPNPVPERAGAATAIIINGQPWIIDAGPGVVRRIEAARRKGSSALSQPNLDRLLLTHLHSDHTLGLPDLMLSPWTLEREKPLKVWGPEGTVQMVDHILKAYEQDIQIRINGAEPTNKTGWKADVQPTAPGIIYRDETLKVEAIPVCHGDWEQAFGYKFIAYGKSIIISGDTTYCPALIKASEGADILIHEVYDEDALNKRTNDWKNYHQKAHTSARDLGKLAVEAKVKHLILHHQLAWSGSKQAIINQIRENYKGPLSWGNDLDVFRLP